MFSHKVQGHMQKVSSFRGQKNGLKSHLRGFWRRTFNILKTMNIINMSGTLLVTSEVRDIATTKTSEYNSHGTAATQI